MLSLFLGGGWDSYCVCKIMKGPDCHRSGFWLEICIRHNYVSETSKEIFVICREEALHKGRSLWVPCPIK